LALSLYALVQILLSSDSAYNLWRDSLFKESSSKTISLLQFSEFSMLSI